MFQVIFLENYSFYFYHEILKWQGILLNESYFEENNL